MEIDGVPVDVKAAVADFVSSWQMVLGLDTWTIHVTWKKRLSKGRAAQVATRVKYKIADIDFSEKELLAASLDTLEEAVVHELAHMLTDPLVDAPSRDEAVIEHFVEAVTTDITTALLRARNAGLETCEDEQRERDEAAAA